MLLWDPFKVTTFVVGTYPLHLHYFAMSSMSGTLKDGKVNLSFNGTRGCEVIFRKEFRSIWDISCKCYCWRGDGHPIKFRRFDVKHFETFDELIQTSGAFSTVLLVMIKYRSTISTHLVDFNKMGLGTQEELDKLAQLLTTTIWSKWTGGLWTLFTTPSFQMTMSQWRKPTNCFTSSRDPQKIFTDVPTFMKSLREIVRKPMIRCVAKHCVCADVPFPWGQGRQDSNIHNSEWFLCVWWWSRRRYARRRSQSWSWDTSRRFRWSSQEVRERYW